MAPGPVERWLDKGWSPFRVTWSALSAVGAVATAIGYAVHPHHPGAVWWLTIAVAIAAAWAISEMVRWRIRHNRLEAALQAATVDTATALEPPAVSAPAPEQLTVAELSHFKHWLPNIGQVQLIVTFQVGNPHPTETARIVLARLDGLTRSVLRDFATNDLRALLRDATGHSGPLVIHPTTSRTLTCEFVFQAPSNGLGGWTDPGECVGNVTLVDEFATEVDAGPVRWG